MTRCGQCSRKLPAEVAATAPWFAPMDPASVALRTKVEASGGLSAYLRGLNEKREAGNGE